MKIRLALLASLLFPLALPAGASQAPPAAAGAQAPAELDLGPTIDKALRWMRGQQDRGDGGYGASVATTARVLRAMIESPRRYQAVDGPFVSRALDYLVARQQASGAIHDAGAAGGDALRQTRLAAGALALHADPSRQPALSKALVFVAQASGEAASNDPGWEDAPLPEKREELLARAQELVAKQAADGSWGGDLAATARNAGWLSLAAPRLKPAAKPAPAAKPLPAITPVDREKAADAIARGASFLASQADKGKYGAPGKPDAGITAMAIGGLLAAPEPRAKEVQAVIDEGLAWLLMLQKPDGSIHDGKLPNYTTSAAIMALARAGRPEHRDAIAKARDFLIGLQVDEGEGYSPDDPYYGGIGYGSSERPDLSNLQMALEALHDSGLEADHAAFQRALRFLQRCQNRSESNDIAIPAEGGGTVVSGDDGGSAYLPGQSFAGFVELEGGKKIARSYGSMTYALLKGYAFAGLPKDDPRMKAAFDWLQANYTLDVNPGFEGSSDPASAYQGLFYYFHVMARALDVVGAETLTDAQGKQHAWRKDLAGRLCSMQRKDGSWLNENSPRWYEGNPILATAYALSTLRIAMPPAK